MHQHKINGLYLYGQGAASPKSGRKERRASNSTSPARNGPVQTISSSSLGIQGTKSYVNKARSENWDEKKGKHSFNLKPWRKPFVLSNAWKPQRMGRLWQMQETQFCLRTCICSAMQKPWTFDYLAESFERDLDTMHRLIRVSYSYELSADPMVAMTDSGVHLLQIMRWRVILASTTCTTMARQMTWDRTLRLEFDGPGGPSHGHSHLLDLWNVLHASLYSLSESVW